VLVSEEMVKAMKPGSVIVHLAAPQGGNCPLTEAGRTVIQHGVTLVGETNLPALVAADASALYARAGLPQAHLPQGRGTQNRPRGRLVTACRMAPRPAAPKEASTAVRSTEVTP
jgi:NAD(P) transhydrogenase subunit alpha